MMERSGDGDRSIQATHHEENTSWGLTGPHLLQMVNFLYQTIPLDEKTLYPRRMSSSRDQRRKQCVAPGEKAGEDVSGSMSYWCLFLESRSR